MLKGADIPSPLNIAGTLDRTVLIFRHRYFSYLMICLIAFGIPFLGVIAMYILDIIDLGGINEILDSSPMEAFYSNGLITISLLVGVPSLLADIALQYFTSFLVRENEITWQKALGKAFSRKTLHYIPVMLLGNLILIASSTVTVFLIFIPAVGTFAWIFLVMSLYAVFVGMGPAIIVEEKRTFLQVIGRNIRLAREKLQVVTLATGLGYLIFLALTFSLLALFILIILLTLSITLGTNDLFAVGGETGTWIGNALLFMVPMLVVLLLIPLKSIFFSVLYYNMRSRMEGFHLENKLDLYTKKVEEKTQEVPEIKATA